ncbi:hypothetical protein O5D80_006336 [Batrachochytrium dendrobatidis]|nr:hypothetical protein O5D80_006336 [Batrachochytrium dendrobatidis]
MSTYKPKTLANHIGSAPVTDHPSHRLLRTASTTSFKTNETSDSGGTQGTFSKRVYRTGLNITDRDGHLKMEEQCRFEPEQASMLLASASEKYMFNQQSNSTLEQKLVDDLFELALDARSETKRAPMRALSKDKKIIIIRQMTAMTQSTANTTASKKPAYYVDQLNQAISGQSHGKSQAERLVDMVTRSIAGTNRQSQGLKDIILELKVQCNCQSMSWLKEFMECGGLNCLINVLCTMHSKTGRKTKHFEIESETLKILRLIANHHSGIADVLYHQNYLNILIQSLDSPMLSARTATMDFLLAIVTLDYPKGHKLVMSAMNDFQKIRKLPRVFDALVEALVQAVSSRGIFGSAVCGSLSTSHTTTTNHPTHTGSNQQTSSDLASLFTLNVFEKHRLPTEKDIREFLVSIIALIRFIVEVPTDFEYRMYLRNEFISSGLVPAFTKLKTWAKTEFSSVLQHVDAFEQLKQADFEYLVESLDTDLDVDIYDPQQLLGTLLVQCCDADRRGITSILQHLLVGTTLMDASSRSHMMYVIESAVMQIVLDQNGTTDFTDTFKYSMSQIINGLQEIQRLDDENARLTAICELQEHEIVRLQQSSNNVQDVVCSTKPPKSENIKTEGDPIKSDSQVADISSKELTLHRDELMRILELLSDKKLVPNTLKTLQPTNDTTLLFRGDSDATVAVESRSSVFEVPNTIQPSTDVLIASGGPPPPPPPPPPPIPGGLGCPPPPPPGCAALPAARLPKYRPKTQVRKMHWERVISSSFSSDTLWSKIKAKDRDAVQDLLNTEGIFAELESMFSISGNKNTRLSTASSVKKNAHQVSQSDTPAHLKIFDEKRAQNLMIFIKSLKTYTPQTLIAAIKKFDEVGLTEELVSRCIKCYPTEDEAKLLHSVMHRTDLRQSEEFATRLMKVYRCKQRLSIMKFKHVLNEQYNPLKLGLLSTMEAFRAVLQSSSLPRLLTVILGIGNFLNSQSNQQASGFRVTFLDKIVDIRSVNGAGLSAIQVLAKIARTSMPDLVDVVNDLRMLDQVNPSMLAVFDTDVKEMQQGLRLIQTELKFTTAGDGDAGKSKYEQSEGYDPELDGVFVHKLGEWSLEVEKKIKFLETELMTLNETIKATFRYFGEPDNSKMGADELVTTLTKFLKGFEIALKDMDKILAAPKDTSTQPAKPLDSVSTPEQLTSNSAQKVIPQLPVIEGIGHMDSLLDSLKARPALNLKETVKRPKRRDPADLPQRLRSPLLPRSVVGVSESGGGGPKRVGSITMLGETALELLGALEASSPSLKPRKYNGLATGNDKVRLK